MKSLLAFFKKEWFEQLRTGKLMILGLLFAAVGVMNPAIAKLTPWLFEILSDSLAENGMIVTEVTVDAMTSWTQFFKNIPIALIAFLLIQSALFTREYESGTLILPLTKGLARSKVLLAKTALLAILWTAGYWLSFGITYGYNAYFWDNAVAQNLLFSVAAWWLFGLFAVALTIFFSTVTRSYIGVLGGTGAVCLASYLLGFLPKIKELLPTALMKSTPLLLGAASAESYAKAVAVTLLLGLALIAAAIPLFHKKTF